MICGRFGPMRKEIVPDNLLHFGGTAGAKRGVDAGCRRAEGGAPYRALSVAIGRRSGGNGERDARGVGGRLFSVGRGLSRRVIALLSFVQILVAASVVVRSGVRGGVQMHHRVVVLAVRSEERRV